MQQFYKKRSGGMLFLALIFIAGAFIDCKNPKESNDNLVFAVLAASMQNVSGSNGIEMFLESGMAGNSYGMAGTCMDMEYVGDLSEGVHSFSFTEKCAGGGSLQIAVDQKVQQTAYKNYFNKSYDLSRGTRKITFNNCSMNERMTIISGTMNVEQSGSASWKSKTENASTVSGTALTDTLSGAVMNIAGSMNVNMKSASGESSKKIELDMNANIQERVVQWVIQNGAPENPEMVSRTGSLNGTVTVDGKPKTINKTF